MDKNNNYSPKLMINGNVGKTCENGRISSQQNYLEKNVVSKNEEDRIAKILAGKNIFITGGSGFLGMVLVEKLLRFCPDVGQIYLLLRPKKGKDPQDRIKDIFKSPFFDLVKEQRGEDILLSKVTLISGDVMELGLDLSEHDKKLLSEEISIIYHCAATVRFDEPLKKAVFLNTRGTQLVIDLAKTCKKLEFFGYVSTAYCHAHTKKTLEEKPYAPAFEPLTMIKACEKLDSNELNTISKKILAEYANTYVFTKSLAEQLAVNTFDTLPMVVLRPSIVTPILEGPIPGWSSNFNGPVGMLTGAGKGVIRTMNSDPYKVGNLIPVDLVINGMLLATWEHLSSSKKDNLPRIYHLTNRNSININWKTVVDYARSSLVTRTSLGLMLWYPGGSINKCKYHHYICFYMYQLIPAILIDTILFCLGIPPVLCKVQRRICQGYEIFQYFANNEWNFVNDNIYNISKMLNKTEQQVYKTGDLEVNYKKYLEDSTYCARKYLLKKKDEDIPFDQKVLSGMYWLDQICKKLIIGYFLYYLFNKIYSMVFPN